ncbi:unnamed protein product, partial [Polarella glacialis]
VRALLAGSPWEIICSDPGSGSSPSSASSSHPLADVGSETIEKTEASRQFRELLVSWRRPRTDLELAEFLRSALAKADHPDEALQTLEAAAPFAQRLAADASGEVLQLLETLVDRVAVSVHELPLPRVVAALRACAVAGLPHAPLFAAATASLDSSIGADQAVEVLEYCAALRLAIPELRPWLQRLREQGLERKLPASGLARLLAASARLALLETSEADDILRRIATVASTMRPQSVETV